MNNIITQDIKIEELERFNDDILVLWLHWGNKESQYKRLSGYIPKKFNDVFEPFAGGASFSIMLYQDHLNKGNLSHKRPIFILNDTDYAVYSLYEKLMDLYNKSPDIQAIVKDRDAKYDVFRSKRYIYNQILYWYNFIKNHCIIQFSDFSTCLQQCSKNDLVFVDPPYYRTNYPATDKRLFDTIGEQTRLVKELNKLKSCYIMVMNNDSEDIRHLYRDWNFHDEIEFKFPHWNKYPMGGIKEILITNF